MATLSCLCSLNLKPSMSRREPNTQNFVFEPLTSTNSHLQSRSTKTQISAMCTPSKNPLLLTTGVLGAGLAALAVVGPASAAELQQQLTEPANALSLPTWAVHVSSVVEWIIAMALVWQYGEVSGYESWKGLSWGMVPLLGGAFCACTWHFFYNSESLEVLVAIQAALTIIGNATMCLAAFRIYKSVEARSKSM